MCEGHQPSGARLLSDARSWSALPASRRAGRLRGRGAGGRRNSRRSRHTAGAHQGVQGESGRAASPCRTQDRRACISAPSFRVAWGFRLRCAAPGSLRCRCGCCGSGSDATRADRHGLAAFLAQSTRYSRCRPPLPCAAIDSARSRSDPEGWGRRLIGGSRGRPLSAAPRIRFSKGPCQGCCRELAASDKR
jgi:hypothetical protein